MTEIIPAMDLIDGKCVRLAQGDFSRKTVYAGDPAETAARFAEVGVRRLHMVDLDGAKTGSPANLAVLERVAKTPGLIVDFGGGVRTMENVRDVLSAGASLVSIGSIAQREPETFARMVEAFGPDRFLLGADARDEKITINGWKTDTDVPVLAFLRRFADLGLKDAFVTDVSRDGMMTGPALGLYRQIRGALNEIRLIASGGVRSMADVDELASIGCAGVIIGKAFYEGGISLKEVSEYAGKAYSTLS